MSSFLLWYIGGIVLFTITTVLTGYLAVISGESIKLNQIFLAIFLCAIPYVNIVLSIIVLLVILVVVSDVVVIHGRPKYRE